MTKIKSNFHCSQKTFIFILIWIVCFCYGSVIPRNFTTQSSASDSSDYNNVSRNLCKSTDKCKIWGTCSQKCQNLNCSYECSCHKGFTLDSDNKTCTANDSNILVVYALRKSIRVWKMNEKKPYSIMENMGQTVAVTVDVRNEKVLWTDISDKREAIYRSDIKGNSTIEIVVDSGLGLAEGLAFDWITGNLYFTDSNKRQIVACRNDGFHCAILVKEFLDKPREITLDPNEGLMFWTNWGEKASIIRAQMNGLYPKPIVLDGLQWPNGLVIDQTNSRLYWSDARFDLIETVNLNGDDRQIVRSKGDSHHFSLDVFADTLYWSDWQVNEIQSCNKFTGKNEKVVVHEGNSGGKTYKPNGLSIFHPAAQPITRDNQCANARCSHICVLAPNNDYSCVCPAGMILDNLERNCKDDLETAKIVIGNENRVSIHRFGSIGRDLVEENEIKVNTQIGAVHYNAINETIFISDTFWRKIHEFNPKTKQLTTVVGEHIDSVTGISLDVIGQNLYWVDNVRRKIEVMSLTTGARALISAEKDYPQDIIVVPEKRFFFVTLTSSKMSRIMKYNMNGYNRTTLVRINHGEPVSITYNRELEHIFWCDIYKETIEHVSLDSRQQSIAVQAVGAFSIASFRNKIFWTDRRTQLMNAMTVLGADYMEQTVFIGRNEDSRNSTLSSYIEGNFLAKISILQKDLSIYSNLMDQHECSVTKKESQKCSHICLMSNEENIGTCLCPDGMELDPDLKTCTAKCYSDQFQCNDKKCIAGDWRCDGFNDCTGGEDETDCINIALPADRGAGTGIATTVPTTLPPTTKRPKSKTSNGKSKIPLNNEKVAPTSTSPSPTETDLKSEEDADFDSFTPPFDAPPQTLWEDEEERSLAASSSSDNNNPASSSKSSAATTTIVVIIVLLLLISTIIIGFILHKRRVSPKTLVQPYVQQLVKYVNRSGSAAKREQLNNENTYDDAFDIQDGNYGSGHYSNPIYEEIENHNSEEFSVDVSLPLIKDKEPYKVDNFC